MGTENVMKLVEFDNFCKTCVHEDKAEWEDPCWECLENPVNVASHKPIKYEEIANVRRK